MTAEYKSTKKYRLP